MGQEDFIAPADSSPGTLCSLPLSKEVTLDLVRIPAGTFYMGSLPAEKGHEAGESPRHRVTLTRGFWLGRHAITQGQWQAVMGVNPSRMVPSADSFGIRNRFVYPLGPGGDRARRFTSRYVPLTAEKPLETLL